MKKEKLFTAPIWEADCVLGRAVCAACVKMTAFHASNLGS
jgi:hypothetical protein